MPYDIYAHAGNQGGMVSSCCRAAMTRESDETGLLYSNWCSACRYETTPTSDSPIDTGGFMSGGEVVPGMPLPPASTGGGRALPPTK